MDSSAAASPGAASTPTVAPSTARAAVLEKGRMFVETPQIRWHAEAANGKNAPILSLDAHPTLPIIATAGADSEVKVSPTLMALRLHNLAVGLSVPLHAHVQDVPEAPPPHSTVVSLLSSWGELWVRQ